MSSIVMHSTLLLLRKWRYFLVLLVLVTVSFVLYNCSAERKYVHHQMVGRNPLSLSAPVPHVEYRHQGFPEDVLERTLDFNMNGNDVIVFLHVQKTGGTTFGWHLTRNLLSASPCVCQRHRKRCQCNRPSSKHQIWLFSRMSVGWACGLHADWTELKACVPEALDKREKLKVRRRYFYVTMMRNPVPRFISEWRHTQRGATWKAAMHKCGGRTPTPEELPPCFTGSTWMGVSLDDFLGCESNMAANRQTRMIADLNLAGCYNRTGRSEQEYDRIILESAKTNLQDMAFFGLTEYQKETQYLFEKTFKMHFQKSLEQSNYTIANTSPISPREVELVQKKNKLDLELYAFAKDLFFQRYHHMKQAEQQEKSKADIDLTR